MNLNKVFLIGRLTRNPEAKNLPSGTAVTNFGLATDRFFNDKAGQKKQDTDFHNIVAFNKLADIASRFLIKGSLVFIEGRIKTRSWQDASGNQRSRTEIIAERLQLGPRQKTAAISSDQEIMPGEREETPVAHNEEIPIIEEGEEIDIKDIPF